MLGQPGSNGHVVRRSFGGSTTEFVVDLSVRDVLVAEQLLDLPDIDSGPEEEGRRRGAERMRRLRARESLDRHYSPWPVPRAGDAPGGVRRLRIGLVDQNDVLRGSDLAGLFRGFALFLALGHPD